MILAISIYGGAKGEFFEIFAWLSAALYLPAITYSAWPFYSNAYHKLQQKKMALDIPVAVILIIASLISFANVLRGSEHFYFDSLSVFIFLLLSARYFLKRIQQKNASTQGVQSLFESTECLKKIENEYIRVNVKNLKAQDLLKILPGETVPLDIQLCSDMVYVNTALITGEHLPRLYKNGDTIPAGSIVVSGNVEGVALSPLKDTQLGKILESVERSWLKGGEEVDLADRLATYLLAAAFVLSFTLVFYFGSKNQWALGMERAMAVLIVTCPCALGLGIPLAYIKGLKNLFKKQIVARNADTLKRIADVKNIFIDKTGTITQGHYSVVESQGEMNDQIASCVYEIEKNSIHPVALGLCRYLSENYQIDNSLKATNIEEKFGLGIFGTINSESWKIIKSDKKEFDVDVFCENKKVMSFRLDDPLKDESAQVLNWFRKQKIKVNMLTGDHLHNAEKVAKSLGFQHDEVFANQVPDAKAAKIHLAKDALMVGDGYNDVVAFDQATVGVAMGKKVDLQLKNADVFIPSGRIEDLLALYKEAKATQFRLRRNIAFSIFYNLIAIVGSVFGVISPLGAAILMPVSSLTVLLSSIWQGEKN
jgi:Cu2+-exporting ATPase/Cu+-exporting ATPase